MEDDDARHKREEAQRKADRRARKHGPKSSDQLEKEQKRKEHRQQILKKLGHDPASKRSKSSSGRSSSQQPHKKGSAAAAASSSSSSSAFQKLFEQRAQGFQIEFRFRNAPPRPPVGPCFVGQRLDAVLQRHAQQYKMLNAVEVHHRWRLHNESDLGVPLAPSAMDLQSYSSSKQIKQPKKLHPDDEALLDWKGSMGDTAAEELKVRQDRARAAARAALDGRTLPQPTSTSTTTTTSTATTTTARTKKAFSRVLDESMQTWMKKTTYLSNDYSRRVHDFKSLAQTKQQLAQDLQQKQDEISKRTTAETIAQSFDQTKRPVHPTNKTLKPKRVYSVLPNVTEWGKPFTHVVVDKKPQLPDNYPTSDLNHGVVANVEQSQATSRMTCDLFAPGKDTEKPERYETIHSFDLDVVPLKEEDMPHIHFCFWLDPKKGVATYVPLSSRVQLSMGRPAQTTILRPVKRRRLTTQEQTEQEERMAEIDFDMADKHHMLEDEPAAARKASTRSREVDEKKGNDDGVDDFGDDDDDDDDDDSGDEALFGGATNTIVAN